MAGYTLVMGLGRSGRAAAELAARRGERVVGVDLNVHAAPLPGVELRLGPHDRRTFLEADRIVVSPGIPLTQPDLAAAIEAGVPTVGELAYAASLLDQRMAAITGTNGKSTVTWFTGQLLRAAGRRPFVGGNLGNPLSSAILDGEPYDVLVVEVSSYQLELEGSLRPDVAVILNLTPDHLARHGDMEGYAAAKGRLFRHLRPNDLAVLPAGDERLARHAGDRGTRAWLGAMPGVVRDRDRVVVQLSGESVALDLADLSIPGEHNRDNAATAALIALALGAEPARVQEGLRALQPLAHRMEVVAERGGIVWINDSKATNVDAARVGISGIGRPAVVLLGGQAKGRGFAELAPLLGRHRAVVCFGGDGPAIADELEEAGVSVHRVGDLAEAVRLAGKLAVEGDAVLLSPGCASFDAFDDFEHRGRVFRTLAQEREP